MRERTMESDNRPEFMVKLGLAPPYSLDDVKQAYFAKARSAHPDHGGDAADFHELRKAYAAAQAYVELHSDRRAWIAKKVEAFLTQQRIAGRLAQFGAQVATQRLEWLDQAFGDFSSLTEAIVAVRLRDSRLGDEVIRYLVTEHSHLNRVSSLDLAGSEISNEAVLELRVLRQLTHLNLSRTRISASALAVVRSLPVLTTLELGQTPTSWWARHRAHRQLRRRARAAVPPLVIN